MTRKTTLLFSRGGAPLALSSWLQHSLHYGLLEVDNLYFLDLRSCHHLEVRSFLLYESSKSLACTVTLLYKPFDPPPLCWPLSEQDSMGVKQGEPLLRVLGALGSEHDTGWEKIRQHGQPVSLKRLGIDSILEKKRQVTRF